MSLAELVAQVELPPPVHDPADVRRLADEVLSRPEYRPDSPSLWERAVDWVADRIGQVVDALAGDAPDRLAAMAVLLALIGALVVVAARVRGSLVPDPSRDVDAVSFGHRPAREWAAEADAFEARGEWRLAVRARYRALLASLAERGAVDDRPGRTGREVEAEVRRSDPSAAPVVSAATDLFEAAWYGDAEVGPDGAARMRELATA